MRNKVTNLILIFLCATLWLSLPAKVFAGTVTSSDFIKNLDINGDLRIRYEYAKKDVDNEDPVDRLRQRFRLGMNWLNTDEDWKLGAGLSTGPTDATSTNQTYSDQSVFSRPNLSLDYAYAEHKIDAFSFIAGQQKNPFQTSWLLWDTDVRPAGFIGQYSMKPLFVTLGYLDARYINNDVAMMGAAQVGIKMDMVTAALAYYQLSRTDEILATDYKVTNLDKDYAYDIIDFYTAGNFKADPVTVKPYAQIWYNAGAKGDVGQSVLGGTLDPEESKNKLGWIIGVDGKVDQFNIGVAYATVGSDSCFPGLKDADFGGMLNSTDVKGFRVDLGYSLTKYCSVSATGMFYQASERDNDQKPQLLQCDLNYKF